MMVQRLGYEYTLSQSTNWHNECLWKVKPDEEIMTLLSHYVTLKQLQAI